MTIDGLLLQKGPMVTIEYFIVLTWNVSKRETNEVFDAIFYTKKLLRNLCRQYHFFADDGRDLHRRL